MQQSDLLKPNGSCFSKRNSDDPEFNAWAAETGLPYTHLSRICTMSIGENYAVERLMAMSGDGE